MKPTQFLYQESIKQQKEQKAQAIKSFGNQQPNSSQQQFVDNQHQSTIYSLVNFPVKEGQNDKVLFPVSLISPSSNIKPSVMVNKNTEIARSLKKLKPLSNSDTISELIQIGRVKSVDQQLHGPKLQVYLKQLNKMTDGLFKKTQTQLLFGSIESKISHNNILCILRIQKLKFFNDYNQKNHKNPALFFWEVLYKKQTLMKSIPKDYEGVQTDLLDFVYNNNTYDILEIVLWKVKNNDEKYVGQFDLINEDYFGAKEILDFQKKVISENWIEKEMFKTMKQTKSYIGNVQFQLIQFGNEKIPMNKYSGIPGSPKTEEERARHRLIDQAMSGQEYRWYIDENDKFVIQKIDSISQEIVAECTLEVVTTECGQLTIIYEQKYNDPDLYGRSRPNSRNMRKQHFDATLALIYELNKNGQFIETQTYLRALSRQGRLSRQAIEEALYQMGCTANQLLLTKCEEFGDCLMDFLLVTDDLTGVLEAMQEIKLIGEDELNLESFSNNLFQQIGLHLRKNINLKVIIQFIKALEKKPEVAILIQNYSFASENILTNNPPFLQNFDAKNYEHIMVFGKLNKMFENFNIDSKFTRAIKMAHIDAKKSIYFDIPCFPKDLDLKKKAESLQLKSIGQNIMHEIVRRQKWNKSHLIFEKYSEWFFVADFQGITPFSLILETAPFDVLQSLFNTYSQQLNTIFQQFNPQQYMYQGIVPIQGLNKQNELNQIKQEINQNKKQKPFQWLNKQYEYRKNYLHNIILNLNLTTNELSEILKSIKQFINQSDSSNFQIIKTQKLRSGDFIPLSLYLEVLKSKCKKKLDRVQREIGTSLFICQMLIPNQNEDQSINEQPKEEQIKNEFVWDLNNQFIIQSIISKLPETLFQQFDDLFRFIQWIPSLEQLKTITFINLPIRLLIKHKQQQKLIILLQQMYNDVKKNAYDINNLESDEIVQILYYFQIQILILLEIRNLKSQNLDSVQNLIINQLKDFVKAYTEILVIPMPTNIIQSYYPFKYLYKGNPETLLELINLIQFNALISVLQVKDLDRLDIKLLGKALKRAKDKESLKDLIKLVLIKNQNKEDTEEQDYDTKEFQIILNPNQILDVQESDYRDKLDKKQIEKLLLVLKAEQFLPLVCDSKSNFNRIVHRLILNSFQTKKSIGVTQQQILLWIRNYIDQISQEWIQLYIDYFRMRMDLYFIHCLIDIEYQQLKKTYINQDKLQPYIQAQGNSWAALLDRKRLAQALKDNIQFVDIEDCIRSVALNGQYEKLELLLPHLKDPQILRQTILLVCIIAENQMSEDYQYNRLTNPDQRFSLEQQLYENDNREQAQSTNEVNLSRQELKRKLREFLDDTSIEEYEIYRKCQRIMVSYKIKSFDLISIQPKNRQMMKQQKEKWKTENVVFPDSLDQIRTPISVLYQLQEMNSNIQNELDYYIKQSYPKSERLDLFKFEQQFEKDIVTFRHLKSWKSSIQRQNLSSLFFKGFQEINLSYKKVLKQLMNEFKKYRIPLCKTNDDYRYLLKILTIYGFINPDEQINMIVSSNMKNEMKNRILFNQLRQILNQVVRPKFQQLQLKNESMNIQQIHYIFKNLNIQQIDDEEEINTILEEMSTILDEIHEILKKLLPNILNPQKAFKFKIASEILVKLDQLSIKNQFEEQFIAISQTISKKNFNDKILQQLAFLYLKEKDQNIKPQGLDHKDVILSFKKKRLDEILSQVELTYYISKFSDRDCEDIVKELFKLPYDKKYKQDLISKFDRRLFECLIFYKRFKTYDTLIHDILFKQIFGGKSEEQNLRLKINQIECLETKNTNLNEVEIQQELNDQNNIQQNSLAQIAAQFGFYEYFDTLHRLNLKVNKIHPFPQIRFTLQSNDQLQILATEFEKKGLNYISNCIKMMRYLRINHYEYNTQQFNFESELMGCFIVEDVSLISNPCLNILKEYLIINGRSQPFWQDSIIQRKSDIKYEKQYKSLFQKKIIQHSLIRLKVNGIEKGVKFCIPSSYELNKNEYSISNDDIRKIQTKRPIFSIDQYIDCLDKNDRQRLDNQIINDPEFQNILKQLQLPSKNQEFLIDKINFIQFLKQILYQDHEIYYYLLNFPMIWYDQKIPKENLNIYNFFLEFEFGIIFFKSIYLFEPKQFNKALDIYLYSLMDYVKIDDRKPKKAKKVQYNYESDYEYYYSEQEEPQDNQINNNRTEMLQISNDQENFNKEIKQKVLKKRRKDYIEPKNGLKKLVQNKCSNQVRFNIFLQLLLLATTNDESANLIQKYLIEYQVLAPLKQPKEIDPIILSRLLEYGYKEPFNLQFIQQIESNNNQLSQQQIEDIKYLKTIISFNQSLNQNKYNELFQLLINQVYTSKYTGYQRVIDNLLEHPAYKCLNKQKNQIFPFSLENDKQFQQQIISYFMKNRNKEEMKYKYRKNQIDQDFIQKFFEVKSNQNFTNDKWIHVICLLKFCFDLENQFKEFDLKDAISKYKIITFIDNVDPRFNGLDNQLDTFIGQYYFKFQINNIFKPPTYSYTKKKNRIDSIFNTYYFNIDINIYLQRSTNPNNPYPIPYIHTKTYDEKDKIYRSFMCDLVYEDYLIREPYQQNEMSKINYEDFFESSILKLKLNLENYKQMSQIQVFYYYYLDEAISTFYYTIMDRGQLEKRIQESEDEPDGIIIQYYKDFFFRNPRIQRNIQLKFQNQFYSIPFSNYKPKIHKTQQNIEIDLTFPELYPVVSLQAYKYKPDIITEEESKRNYDSLSLIQSACNELNLYAKLLNEFLNKIPNDYEERLATRDVYWPLIQKKVKPQIKDSNMFEYTYIIETIPIYLVNYLFDNLNLELNHEIKFTLNCLSFTEIILTKLIRIIQKHTGKKCKIATSISILKEWVWLKQILAAIGDIILQNDLKQFIAYYVEINEIHPNLAFQFKSNKLEGVDSLFRFGKTQFFIHSGVLIIRLNIAQVSENPQSILNMKNYKLQQIQSNMFKEDKEIFNYMQFIVTFNDMIKQIFNKN
ncbi:unnamed protein product [Paramecium pentaurelia]|uniref:Uncharacterized protein n=1 Tax=Paramecium pentaurelia TaxID=43138 RepID=A0A8S1U2T9_9CILI|nr:unnamed protein product [Paramecium pentaurelia]